MTEHSVRLYGRPGDQIAGSAVNNLEAAQHFISAADDILGNDAFRQQNRIFEIVSIPWHKGDQNVPSQSQFTQLCGWSIGNDVTGFHHVPDFYQRFLVNAG